MGYQPRPNCRLHHDGLCNHTSARRLLRANKPCILVHVTDPRIAGCAVQVPRFDPPAAPPTPSPPPPSSRRSIL